VPGREFRSLLGNLHRAVVIINQFVKSRKIAEQFSELKEPLFCAQRLTGPLARSYCFEHILTLGFREAKRSKVSIDSSPHQRKAKPVCEGDQPSGRALILE